MKRLMKCAAVLALALVLLLPAGCGQREQTPAAEISAYTDAVTLKELELEAEAVPLAAAPAVSTTLMPEASGTLTKKNDKAVIDYSNTEDGYVMVSYTASTAKKLKAQVKGPSGTTYTYDIHAGGGWTTFPLSDGSGAYKVTVYENTSGSQYATVLSLEFTVTLRDEFAPFLRPNQYVNYAAAPNTRAKAAALCKGLSDPLDKVKAVYQFVVTNLTYDHQKAASVQSGYLPVLDTVLAEKTGICFDYASLMTAMLRAQGVPCKLVVGYAGTAYHAWINVWSADKGWITAAIYFDGDTWQRMDPTFASSAKQSKTIMKYIGDGSHYSAKYIY
ncbi:MAG: transglutaminase-like domain-containing protein [Oscillibacter sp.]|jgi:outer membrane lipoprotein-sorting protein|nr:transglutaminase-like domain-containing protein [Oscillibacter sp.]